MSGVNSNSGTKLLLYELSCGCKRSMIEDTDKSPKQLEKELSDVQSPYGIHGDIRDMINLSRMARSHYWSRVLKTEVIPDNLMKAGRKAVEFIKLLDKKPSEAGAATTISSICYMKKKRAWKEKEREDDLIGQMESLPSAPTDVSGPVGPRLQDIVKRDPETHSRQNRWVKRRNSKH